MTGLYKRSSTSSRMLSPATEAGRDVRFLPPPQLLTCWYTASVSRSSYIVHFVLTEFRAVYLIIISQWSETLQLGPASESWYYSCIIIHYSIYAFLQTWIIEYVYFLLRKYWKNTASFYFYLSNFFGQYFYFYLSKKNSKYLYFYLSTLA